MSIQSLACLLLLLCTTSLQAGYAHYWTWKNPPDSAKLKKCIDEMKLILQASPVPLASVDGNGQPAIRDSMITFNMKGEEDDIGEPFVFPGRTGHNFCKTNGKGYDPVVTACLLVVMDHFGKDEVTVSSDGNMAEDWEAGAALYKKVLGRTPKTGKNTALEEIIGKIDLKPKWDGSRLWIVFGLIGLGAFAAWYLFNPKPDFTIYFEQQGNAYVKGAFPEVYAGAVSVFFKQDLPMKRNALVKGWNEQDGRFRLAFAGPISDREQQKIRNFFGMLRKK
jgi:hypothetical protein